jgi:thioesterase domain-containing protein/acyl carrier protein
MKSLERLSDGMQVAPERVATRSSKEAIAKAWPRVLNRQTLLENLPFDVAGGDSLKWLRLICYLEEEIGVRLPPEAFRSHLRPSEMALGLDAFRAGDYGSKDGALVFLVGGAGAAHGDQPALANFRAKCRPLLRFHCLNFPSLAHLSSPHFTFDSFVTYVVEQIERECPSGDIRLAGFSFGGHVAHAAAIALQARGRRIGFLGLLDVVRRENRTINSSPSRPLRLLPIRLMRKAKTTTQLLRSGSYRQAVERSATLLANRLASVDTPYFCRLAGLCFAQVMPSTFSSAFKGYFAFFMHGAVLRRWMSTSNHKAVLTDVPVFLARAEGNGPDLPADLGWKTVCENLKIETVSGSHSTMLDEPYLDHLCSVFRDAVLETTNAESSC